MIDTAKFPHGRGKKIAWISFTVIDFCNLISQTQVLKELAGRGYSISFFAARSKKTTYHTESSIASILIPLRYVPIVSSSLYLLTMALFLPFFLLAQRPNYVILEIGPSILGPIFIPLRFALKFKLVIDMRSVPIRVKHGLRESLHLLLFRSSVVVASRVFDGMTVLTELMKKWICDQFNICSSFPGVWTSGVSNDLFNPARLTGHEIREKLKLEGKFLILYHGALGLGRTDGILAVINSLKTLRSRHKNITLLLLGGGDGLSLLKKAIRESQLEQAVLVHQSVDYSDVPKFIAACDLGIVPLPDSPNWRYQCPLKLLEYMAMGKVVIVTDIPAHRTVIGTCKCGIYVKSIDPMEIAEAIDYAYDNLEKLNEWGRLGKAIVEKEYSWKEVAEDLDNYLSKL
jgi:glycosyltransferase involved in cell wall biosynthesis